MTLESAFDRKLLKQHPSVRIENFRTCKLSHKKIEEASDEVLRLIFEPANSELINLVGPTGVGKSTLIEHVIKAVYERVLSLLANDPGWIPAMCITAQNPETGGYDWKEHYIDVLIACRDVLVERKIDLSDQQGREDEVNTKMSRRVASRSALRRAAQSALTHRHPLIFFVDEAQYFTKRKRGEGLKNQADSIRSFAYLSRALHCLVGTYDLLALRNLNGQLGRRSHTVHFSRYRADVAEDVKAFRDVYYTLLSKIPVAKPPKLSEVHLEYCFLRCLGCIGLLKNWLMRSLAAAIEDKCDTIDYKLFKRTQLPNSVCKQIASEIYKGEEKLDEGEDDATEAILRLTLGVTCTDSPAAATTTTETEKPENSQADEVRKTTEAALAGCGEEATGVSRAEVKELIEKGAEQKGKKKGSGKKEGRRGRRRIEPAPRRYKVGTEEVEEEDAA